MQSKDDRWLSTCCTFKTTNLALEPVAGVTDAESRGSVDNIVGPQVAMPLPDLTAVGSYCKRTTVSSVY